MGAHPSKPNKALSITPRRVRTWTLSLTSTTSTVNNRRGVFDLCTLGTIRFTYLAYIIICFEGVVDVKQSYNAPFSRGHEDFLQTICA